VGALISATGSTLGPARSNAAGPSDVPSGGEIFRLAEIRKLRILIAVPQTNAPGVRIGQTATVTVQQIPNLSFKGKVTRTSSSLDAQSRTLLTEVDVDNPKEVLLPGMYAMVSFITDRIDPPFLVPDAALVVRSSGTVLAVLQPLTGQEQQKARSDGIDPATLARVRRVHFQTVAPGRDYGIELEILDGLNVGQEVAVDPTDAVQEGALVQIAAPNASQAAQNSNKAAGNSNKKE
jgi:multidrug efflux pump subunit AcrA (membrane-fusion protein)